MGTTNFGGQSITFDYKQPAESEDFNKLNYKLIEPGIYDWLDKDTGSEPLTRISNSLVEVAPMTFFITDATTGNAVRIETSAAPQLSVSAATPFIVWRYSWSNVETWYADLVATDFVSIQSTDLIVGRAVYDGATLRSDFDYTRRHDPPQKDLYRVADEFKVVPTEPVTSSVFVPAGKIIGLDSLIEFAGGNSPAISDTTTNGRIDVVYITDAGAVGVIEGTEAAVPLIPDFAGNYVVALITRGPSSTVVTGADITQLQNDRRLVLTDQALRTTDNVTFNTVNGMTDAEMSQIENINATTISTTQWVYLGSFNQNLRTTDNVTFGTVTSSRFTGKHYFTSQLSGTQTRQAVFNFLSPFIPSDGQAIVICGYYNGGTNVGNGLIGAMRTTSANIRLYNGFGSVLNIASNSTISMGSVSILA